MPLICSIGQDWQQNSVFDPPLILWLFFPLIWPWTELSPPLLWLARECPGAQPALPFPGQRWWIERTKPRDQPHPSWHSECCVDTSDITPGKKQTHSSLPWIDKIILKVRERERESKMCLNAFFGSCSFHVEICKFLWCMYNYYSLRYWDLFFVYPVSAC